MKRSLSLCINYLRGCGFQASEKIGQLCVKLCKKKNPGDVQPRFNPFTPRREISRKGRAKIGDYFGTCKPSGSLSAACRLQSYSSRIASSTSLFIFTPSLRSQLARRMVSGLTDSVMLRRGDCDGLRPAPARLPPWVVFCVFISCPPFLR